MVRCARSSNQSDTEALAESGRVRRTRRCGWRNDSFLPSLLLPVGRGLPGREHQSYADLRRAGRVGVTDWQSATRYADERPILRGLAYDRCGTAPRGACSIAVAGSGRIARTDIRIPGSTRGAARLQHRQEAAYGPWR